METVWSFSFEITIQFCKNASDNWSRVVKVKIIGSLLLTWKSVYSRRQPKKTWFEENYFVKLHIFLIMLEYKPTFYIVILLTVRSKNILLKLWNETQQMTWQLESDKSRCNLHSVLMKEVKLFHYKQDYSAVSRSTLSCRWELFPLHRVTENNIDDLWCQVKLTETDNQMTREGVTCGNLATRMF